MELDQDNIQGNILPGFNKDHQAFILTRFRDADGGRKWLNAIQPELASYREVEAFRVAFRSMKERRPGAPDARDGGALHGINATWVNVALGYAGLRMLDGSRNPPRFPRAFRENRVPGANTPALWADAHALLIVAADYARNLDDELDRQTRRMAACGVELVTCFRGAALPGDQRGHEHFGFKDAISQPAVQGTSTGNGPPVAAGEFVVGYPDQLGQSSGNDLPAWTKNGSFLAFVQLQQHVQTFWKSMHEQAAQLGVTADELAAWIVGRRADADGTPVSEPPARLSHVGRAYARWLPPAESLRHRVLRRGIPYGSRLKDGAPDDDERGLLFLGYQADIERQFEYVWAYWLNSPSLPVPGAGRDALVGQLAGPGPLGPLTDPNSTAQYSPAARRTASTSPAGQKGAVISLSLPGFVTPRYGGYFFAPSISGVGALSTGTR